MGLSIKPSDLKFKYPKVFETRYDSKFAGEDDTAPFNRDDLFDIIPMLEAVMDELDSDSGRLLHSLEDLMNEQMPRFVTTRGEVFRFLTYCGRDIIENR